MYIKALGLFFVLNVMSVIFYACCENVYQVMSEEFSVNFSQITEEDDLIEVDTITGEFIYGLWAEVEGIGFNDHAIGIINSAYATSCEDRYINKFISSTAKVSLDRAIKIDGELFEAGENLLALDDLFTGDIYNARVLRSGIKIQFKIPFLTKSEFEPGEYEFHAFVELEDGDIIESRDTVYIAL